MSDQEVNVLVREDTWYEGILRTSADGVRTLIVNYNHSMDIESVEIVRAQLDDKDATLVEWDQEGEE